MVALVATVIITLGVSAMCSLLEAFILSSTVADIEALKRSRPRMGQMLERFREGIDVTSSAILTLNTVANTLGATLVGLLASRHFAHTPDMHFMLWAVPAGMVVGILVFSEILPKNIGVAYRRQLQPVLVYPLMVVRFVMWPVAVIARYTIRSLLPSDERKDSGESEDEEILLLADKQA
ncbi:MAG: DUF21 domain-containing protein, partial [Opitutales bacterium]